MRGVAACMVVLYHASQNWSLATTDNTSRAWFGGIGGVDLFFVISGFVMFTSAYGPANGPQAAKSFMKRRIARVMPLYWLITTALVLKSDLGLMHNPASRGIIPSLFTLSSYLLIPFRGPDGVIAPVLKPGWTLSFEMLFYVCLASALWFRRPPMRYMTILLLVLVVMGLSIPPQAPAVLSLLRPLLLEFLSGFWLGYAFRAGWRPNPAVSGALGALALLALFALPDPGDARVERIAWGVLAFLVIHASVALEPALGKRLPRGLLMIGDASYSIYLTHAPLLGLYTFLLKRAGVLVYGRVLVRDELVTAGTCLMASIAVGVVCYRLVELPLNRWSKRVADIKRPLQMDSTTAA